MIYVDEIRDYGSKGEWCHLWSDNGESELHSFAIALGLQRSWVHRTKGLSGEFVHYDLRPSKRKQALKFGAQFMPLKQWIKQNSPTGRKDAS